MRLSNWVQLSLIIVVTLLIWSLKEIIILIFASVVLAIATCSIVDRVKRFLKIPRSFSLAITLASIIFISAIGILIIVPQFSNEFQELITQIPSAAKSILIFFEKTLEKISSINFIIDKENIINYQILESIIFSIPDGATLANGFSESLGRLLGIASNLGVGIIRVLFIISVSLMITIQPDSYKEALIMLIPSFYRRRFRYILNKCGKAIDGWLFGIIISSTFVAFLAGFSLYILGVKLVVANALIAGILNIIPNIGPTIGTIFPMLIAFLDAPWKSLAVLGFYIIIQNIESYLITPSIMQKQTKILPAILISSQFIFTILFGPIGLLIALPLTVILQVLVKEIIIDDILNKQNNIINFKN